MTLLQYLKRRRLRIAAENLAQAKAEVEALRTINHRAPHYIDRFISASGRVGKYEERVEQLMRE